MSERRQEFEHDLEAIEAKVIELFALVAEDLPRREWPAVLTAR